MHLFCVILKSKEKKMSKSKYQENLIKTVMDKSWGNTWEEAVQEWDIIDCAEDNSLSRSCICGKEQIKYLYRLHNRKTNQWLFPIGSSCIKKFQRKDLQEKTATTEAMFKLLHAVGNNICSYHLICLVENFLKNYMIKEHSRRLHIIIIIQKMIMIFC
jgi:hypothetical protein